MKQFITLLIGLLSILNVYAEERPVGTEFKKKGGAAAGNSIGRVPMHLPIEVTFDDATGILRVSAPEDLEGTVHVYSVSGALEGSSQNLNATFTLTTPGLHVISLQGENWIGEGKIVF